MKPKNNPPPWPRPKTSPTTMVVAVGWYTKDEWTKVKAAAVDAERFEETYAEWVHMAEHAVAEIRAPGIAANASYVKASELLA